MNQYKRYKITYFTADLPEEENVVIEILAKDYEEACVFAKGYKRYGFAIEECSEG